ncbi:MAG: GIY-YIG nuclease family protein, partial [Eubacteriales bacterium]|nr:GIY-YIG nuclease family protein [Eubacteriales bacterium]
MTQEVEFKLAHLPESPGCYLMRSGDTVIYIGKAKNLKNRVRQYFHSQRNHGPKVRAMVAKVTDFDTVL